jgi:hypothetical protein
MVPVDTVAIGQENVKAAIQQLSATAFNVPACLKLLEDAVKPPVNGDQHLGLITPEWQRARKNLCCPPGHNWIEVFADGMEVGVARCAAVNAAKGAGLKYIFFNDWDTILPADALIKLAYHLDNNPDYGIASGLYCMKSIPPHPLIWKGWNEGVFYDFTLGDMLKDGIVGIPMGCALLRLSMFDELPQTPENPWFRTVDDTVKIGLNWCEMRMTEDLWFTKRLTDETKWKIMVDTSILCDHIDHQNGRRYTLGTDSIPMKRAIEKGLVKV